MAGKQAKQGGSGGKSSPGSDLQPVPPHCLSQSGNKRKGAWGVEYVGISLLGYREGQRME